MAADPALSDATAKREGLSILDRVRALRAEFGGLEAMLAEPVGIISPRQFVTDFGHLHTARVVYEGKLTGKFAEDVRVGKYGVAEGVVCKGGVSPPPNGTAKLPGSPATTLRVEKPGWRPRSA